MNKVIAVLISLILYFLILLAFGPKEEGLNFEAKDIATILRPFGVYMIFYLAMCVGILFSAAFRHIKQGSGAVASPVSAILKSWHSQSFVLGILVSPIVFAAVATQIEARSEFFPSILLSFRNGYFWENIFRSVGDAPG